MKIIVKATNTTLTPAIKGYVEEKVGGLEKFLKNVDPNLVEARVEIDRTTPGHHRQGDIFRAEINLSIGSDLLRTESSQESIYAALDVARDELARMIKKRKEKERSVFMRGARSWKKFWRLDKSSRRRGSKVEEIIE